MRISKSNFLSGIHKKIQDIYSFHKNTFDLNPEITESKYLYVTSVGVSSPLIPESLKEEMCFTSVDENYENESLNGKNFESLQPFRFSLSVISRHFFELEKRIILAHQMAGGEKIVSLEEILKEFYVTLPFWRLGRFPNQACVYGIYYFGSKPLYSKVVGSRKRPIYIGIGSTDIGEFLLILKDSKLPIQQFAIRIFLLNNSHYCSSLHSMFSTFSQCFSLLPFNLLLGILTEFYQPLWNSKKIGLLFNDAYDEESIWHLYHIKRVQKIVTTGMSFSLFGVLFLKFLADGLIQKFYHDNLGSNGSQSSCVQQ